MGRTATIRRMINADAFSLSVGAGITRLAKVNVDISRSKGIDVLCSASHLPFRDGIFQEIIFTDVIEHLPKGSEENTFSELARVLTNKGRILLTTPNHRLLFTLLDPTRWLTQHRHYTINQINKMVKATMLNVEREGTFGDPLETLRLILMYSAYPIKRIIGFYPKLFFEDHENPDQIRKDYLGYTLFIIASK